MFEEFKRLRVVKKPKKQSKSKRAKTAKTASKKTTTTLESEGGLRSLGRLEPRHKDFIYHHLALGRGNLEITKLFEVEFKAKIAEATVRQNYAIHKDKIEEKRAYLREHLEEITPLALEQRRLAEYHGLYEDAKKIGQRAIENLMETAKSQVEAGDTDVMVTIAKLASESIAADSSRLKISADLLKQIGNELKPLRIELNDKTPKGKSIGIKNWNVKNVDTKKLKAAVPKLEKLMEELNIDSAEIDALQP